MALIIVGVVLVIIILWFISAQRKLVAMDENINNAMARSVFSCPHAGMR